MTPSDELFTQSEVDDSLQVPSDAPLAARMRPVTLDEIVGQEHLLGSGKLLRRTLESDRLSSLILYGPPGTGKTTLALVIARMTSARYVQINAVLSNVAEMRKVQGEAHKLLRHSKRKTVLFIDEIHRFNKAQQDILMPDVESGVITLIGATTQNPSFAIRGPLLSRSIVCELKPLEESHLIRIMKCALADKERGLGNLPIEIGPAALAHIAKQSSGDARRALNAIEVGAITTPPDKRGVVRFTEAVAEESCQKKIVHYDWDEDFHYDTISAFIKSLRGSDVDAAIYWLARMFYAGEDPRFIVRRLVIFASEDIGNADPQALILATSGFTAVEFVGMPEARIILAQIVTYLALAPKSNASYMAIENATEDVKTQKSEQVPQHLRSTAYHGAKDLGHGKGYVYPHDRPGLNKHMEGSQDGPNFNSVEIDKNRDRPEEARGQAQFSNEKSEGSIGPVLPIVKEIKFKAGQAYLDKTEQYYAPKPIGFEKTLIERLQFLRKSPPEVQKP